MRAHLSDVIRRPSTFGDWWEDLPMRWRWWWREVLLEPGAGWLRWKPAWRERIWHDPPDIDQWVVYPPLHRAWLTLSACWTLPWLALRGQIQWREARPSLADTENLVDEDRSRLYR